ncbi:hypothetical protein UlMin_021944 [Ulmus minor]
MNYEDLSNVYVSQDDFKLFHSIDRELYSLMVITLLRDPAESLQIMALWLWLEQKGFKNVVKQMLSFPHFLINELAEEALSFLNFISTGNAASFSYENGDMSVIQSLMEKEMAFQFFHENRINAAQEIAKIAKEVCIRALGDIMERAILERKATLTKELAQKSHQMAIGAPVTVTLANHLDSSVEIHPDDRTMFVTFSKGYPVFEWELEKFFTATYGNCLESIHMQEVGDNEQSLFARIVFVLPSTIETILDGLVKAKFTINGKHVWMRKFVPKRNRAVLLQQHQG